MLHYIPVLTPTDAQLFVKYFSGVDKTLARRFTLGFSPDEEHLTSLLCELLDERGSELHQLPYTANQLNEDLHQNNSLLKVSFKLETIQYNKFQERNITQSDIGIIVNYTDNIKRDNSFRKGILLQAKKLFPGSNDTYTIDSQYKSFNSEQHNRLISLVESVGKRRDSDDGINYECAAYLFYNPPFNSLAERDKEIILHEQLSKVQNIYRERMYILERFGEMPYFMPHLTDSSFLLEASSLVVPIDDIHRVIERSTADKTTNTANLNLKSILEYTNSHINVFAHFVVFGLLLGDSGCQNKEWLKVVSGIRPNVAEDVGIFRPRYVFTVNISAGTALG